MVRTCHPNNKQAKLVKASFELLVSRCCAAYRVRLGAGYAHFQKPGPGSKRQAQKDFCLFSMRQNGQQVSNLTYWPCSDYEGARAIALAT